MVALAVVRASFVPKIEIRHPRGTAGSKEAAFTTAAIVAWDVPGSAVEAAMPIITNQRTMADRMDLLISVIRYITVFDPNKWWRKKLAIFKAH